MTRQINLKGYRLSKDGKLVRNERRLDVSARLRQRSSKRIRPAKRGEA
jgi:hypothetical protein